MVLPMAILRPSEVDGLGLDRGLTPVHWLRLTAVTLGLAITCPWRADSPSIQNSAARHKGSRVAIR